jgi:hypothetical protein
VKEEAPGIKDVKKAILVSFYSQEKKFKTSSKSLRELHKEIVIIRDELKKKIPSSTFTEGWEPTRIQSYYCMTKESDILLELRSFLKSKLTKIDVEGLHFIPMYDGALIRHDKFEVHNCLIDYVEEFNKSLDLFVFERKKIELPTDCVVKKENFETYLNVSKFFAKLSTFNFGKLLVELNIEEFSLDDDFLSHLLREMESRKKFILKLKDVIKAAEQKCKKLGKLHGNEAEENCMQGEDITALKPALSTTTPIGYLNKTDIQTIKTKAALFNMRVRAELIQLTGGSTEKLDALMKKLTGKGCTLL